MKKVKIILLWLGRGLLALFAFILIATLLYMRGMPASRLPLVVENSIPGAIPIEKQDFFQDLEKISSDWNEIIIGQVEGDNPRTTLLNFYSAMSLVGKQSEALESKLAIEPGPLPSKQIKDQIDDAELLFDIAIKSLDLSYFPESVRQDLSQEAAIKLKHVLDYVFTHSSRKIYIPDYSDMLARYKDSSNYARSWRIPGTAITLSDKFGGGPGDSNFYFTANSVRLINKMYDEIKGQSVVNQPYATPGFYRRYVTSPGYLVSPKWYARIPRKVKRVIEARIGGQTLFQVVAGLFVFYLYFRCVIWFASKLISTYKLSRSAPPPLSSQWFRSKIIWMRVFYMLPILVLTRFIDDILDDVINFTSVPLVVTSYVLIVVFYLCLGVFVYWFLEATGRSVAELLPRLRGSHSTLQLRRVSNLVMPFCRALGVLVSVVCIYRMLLVLGLPANTVLAFSAVPGLAIGLGASKLLSNLFAGLSIQTDRPLRVGEFCQIGDNLGFVTKIGLRSLELKTLESIVKIPNSVADEATVINFSRHAESVSEYPSQGIELRYLLPYKFSPFQLNELLRHCRSLLDEAQKNYNFSAEDAIVSFGKSSETSQLLTMFVLTELQDWKSYLSLRELLFMGIEESVGRVDRCVLTLKVAYSTTSAQLQALPDLLRVVVDEDPLMQFVSCELVQISDFSFNHQIELSSHHPTQYQFDQSMHQLNQHFLRALAAHGIEIPYPSQTLLIDGLKTLGQGLDDAST